MPKKSAKKLTRVKIVVAAKPRTNGTSVSAKSLGKEARKAPTPSQKPKPLAFGQRLAFGKQAWRGAPMPPEHDPRPRWTWDKGMTYSMLSDFSVCRESFRRKYVMGYQQSEDEEDGLNPKDFGNLFHHLSEKFFGLVPTERQVNEEAGQYVEGAKRRATDKGTLKGLDRLALTCAMIFRRHQEHWNETPTFFPVDYPATTPVALRKKYPHGIFDRQFSVIERERTFKVKHYYAPGKWVWLRGKIDGIFDVPVLNERCVLENKTKSSINEIGLKETLHEDMQTNIYLYASHRVGYPMRHVVYNVIRRPKHRWDEGKETLVGHVARIEEESRKKPDHFFKRFDRTVDPTLVEKFIAHTINPLLNQQNRWWESIKANPTRPWHVHGKDGEPIRDNDGGFVVNLDHWEHPYGPYDPYAFNPTGHQFAIRIQNDYSNYRQVDAEELFPELDDDSDALIVED